MAPQPLPLADDAPVAVWSAVVNGNPVRAIIKSHDVLLDVIRDGIGSLGTKRGCDMGTCGCCTVMIDGKPRLSCLTLAMEAKNHQITTVEGLSDGHYLHPIQDMFAECGGSRCGFCTPGFLVASAALLDGNPSPTREEAMQAIEGNLCRCTGYQQIIDSIMSASKILSEGSQIQATTEPASDPHPNSRG